MQGKQNNWPYLLMIAGLSFWLCAIQWMIWIQSTGLKETNRRYNQFMALAINTQKRSNKNEHLTREINALNSHPGRIEGIAREKLNMIKKGELFYEIVPKEATKPKDITS